MSSTPIHHLIINPVAGRGRAQKMSTTAEAFLTAAGIPFQTYVTRWRGHACEMTRALPADAIVLSLGGDGTLHEIATASVGTARKVGVLPAGSGDDFAFALGINRHNLTAALNIIRQGHIKKVDTATVNGVPFINSLGTGFDADVASAVASAPFPLRESSAYIYAVLATLSKLRNIPVTVTIDGTKVHDGPALLVATQNGPRTGGSFLFAPDARIDDGTLELVIAGALTRWGTITLLPKVMQGKHLQHPSVKLFKGKHITLNWTEARPAHMEGELLSASKQFDINVKPASLKVFAPEGT